MDEPIWEGPVGRNFTMRVMPIGDNMHRGVLELWRNSNNTLAYQKEVTVNRELEGGANQTTLLEWQKVVSYWLRNFS